MIKYINTEPFVKRMLYLMFLFFLLTGVSSIGIQNYQLNMLHKQQIKSIQALTGRLASVYPEGETDIVRAIFNSSLEDEKVGESILEKYGYDSDTKISQDTLFREHYNRIMVVNLSVLGFIALVIGLIFILAMGLFIKRLEKLSSVAEYIAEDILPDNNISEGIISRINDKLYDVSKALKVKLHKLDAEKENLTSLVTDISHQLKTPLASIRLYNSLLSEEDLSREDKSDFLKRSETDINKLEWLVGSLVKVSRLEVGMIEVKLEKQNLKGTLVDAINGIYAKALKKNMEIDMVNVVDCYAYYDPKWTKEAIFNVLENAVKYTHINGMIKVTMVELTSYIRIDIEDNGISIPKEEFNNIFKRFYRGKQEEVKNIEGSGVGLYLTRKILEEQGACITVESTLGKGTRFSLFLQKCKEV
jgi:signal transduction histidine kinase